jgi:hypothetical protein
MLLLFDSFDVRANIYANSPARIRRSLAGIFETGNGGMLRAGALLRPWTVVPQASHSLRYSTLPQK